MDKAFGELTFFILNLLFSCRHCNWFKSLSQIRKSEIYHPFQIGADGFKSLLRKSCDIHTMQWDYNQFAVCATLNISHVSYAFCIINMYMVHVFSN